jgi:hypothetical protein
MIFGPVKLTHLQRLPGSEVEGVPSLAAYTAMGVPVISRQVWNSRATAHRFIRHDYPRHVGQAFNCTAPLD